ncbi:hypothetical protein KFE25_013328 [Diacronema lutheri]|uniref:DUF2306 domain-containing protein n=1 Tax=Diacronema lutheri TaxID=2081491 RepID=A0A8J6CFP9_DIALT|nr:hypothetical protein KFE25_013328 [Diacronema lutheri]
MGALTRAGFAVAYVACLVIASPFLWRMLTAYIFSPWRSDAWVELLPRLNAPGLPSAGMYVHWCAGFAVMVLGFIQPLTPVRKRWPAVHRASGHAYCLAALLTSCGGLVFIWTSPKLCVGGWNMNVAFSAYGLLLAMLAVGTWVHGRARRFERHRNWAIRLWGQGMASLLYRLYYIGLAAGGYALSSEKDFHRPLDSALDWWFFLPNLLVAEGVIVLLGPHRPALAAKDGALALLDDSAAESDGRDQRQPEASARVDADVEGDAEREEVEGSARTLGAGRVALTATHTLTAV